MTDPQVIVNLGTGGSDLNGQNGSTTSADSNDARFLDWPGDNAGNYVYLPGANGNFLTVPDEAALDITGDIDIRCYLAHDDWVSSSATVLLAKRNASATEYSWSLFINTTGTLELNWTINGTTAVSTTTQSSVVLDLVDYEAYWIRATLDVDNGAGGATVKYYTSVDGSTWTQLGTDIVLGAATSIYSGIANVGIGAQYSSGTSAPIPAKIYRAQVLDGIDGTMVLDVDTSVITTGAATSFTALTGQTVTINRSSSGRKSVAVVSPVWLFGTDDYMEVADNALLNFGASDDFTLVAVVRRWPTVAYAPLVYKANTSTDFPGWRLRGESTEGTYRVYVRDSAGTTEFETVSIGSEGDLHVIVARRQAPDFLQIDSQDTTGSTGTATINDMTNTLPLVIGAESDYQSPTSMELISISVFRRPLSDAEMASVMAYYDARLS
jgi:hypothetical protein